MQMFRNRDKPVNTRLRFIIGVKLFYLVDRWLRSSINRAAMAPWPQICAQIFHKSKDLKHVRGKQNSATPSCCIEIVHYSGLNLARTRRNPNAQVHEPNVASVAQKSWLGRSNMSPRTADSTHLHFSLRSNHESSSARRWRSTRPPTSTPLSVRDPPLTSFLQSKSSRFPWKLCEIISTEIIFPLKLRVL